MGVQAKLREVALKKGSLRVTEKEIQKAAAIVGAENGALQAQLQVILESVASSDY